jgi:hypothetical protein
MSKLIPNNSPSQVEREVRARMTWRIILIAASPLPLLLLMIYILYRIAVFNSESIIELHGRNVEMARRLKCLEESVQQILQEQHMGRTGQAETGQSERK